MAPDTDPAGARQLVAELQSVMTEPVLVADHKIVVGASFGTASFPADGRSMDDLLHAADARMYETKRERRARATAAEGEWVSY